MSHRISVAEQNANADQNPLGRAAGEQFRIVDKGRVSEISQRQSTQQQRDFCQRQVGKLTDARSKLCTRGAK
jgi:hypothetical protein